MSPDVLIPRQETEILVAEALKLLPEKESSELIDLGTGSGCIGLSLALKRPHCKTLLIDKSAEALAIAARNAAALMTNNVELLQCDLNSKTDLKNKNFHQVDLIVANPPYIEIDDPRVEASVANFEPHIALYSDQKGFGCLKSWLFWSFQHLKPGGYYIFEFGQGQETELSAFIAQTDYSIIDIISDYSGIKRFFKLKK